MELYLFIVGLCLGSFLNVCIYRVPRKLSVLFPARSFCPHCKVELPWQQNIPLVTWLLQRGKCKSCGGRIPAQYPLVEFLGGIAAVASYLQFGLTPTALVVFAMLLTLITISFIDLEFQIIPDRISKPGMILGLILGVVSQYTDWFRCRPYAFCPVTQSAADSLAGFFLGYGVLFLIGWGYFVATKKEGLGRGDLKLLGMTGAVLGWHSVFPTIFAGSLVGAVIGVGAMIVQRSGRHTEIPFGPWLSIGAVLYIFTGLPLFRI